MGSDETNGLATTPMTENGTDDSTRRAPCIDVMAHPYRRYLLYTLYLFTPPLQLADIAHQITVWETGEPADRHLDERLEVYMALYHDHLPELVDADVVDYDQRGDVVDLGPLGDRLKPVVAREFGGEVEALLEAEAGTFRDAE